MTTESELKPLRIVAFDIGFRNFAWCVADFVGYEEAATDIRDRLASLERVVWWSSAGWTDWWDGVFSRVFHLREVHNVDLTVGEEDGVYRSLHAVLGRHREMFATADRILIEQQMAARHQTNVKALKIAQHVMAFFYIHFPEKRIEEFPASHKTTVFACFEKHKADRKRFAVSKAAAICAGDPVATDMIATHRKKDDISDCILMTVAAFYQELAGDHLAPPAPRGVSQKARATRRGAGGRAARGRRGRGGR